VSLSTRVLLALGAGVGVGLAIAAAGGPVARVGIAIAEPVGALFVNAIRMTVIPLVVTSLVVGIATSGGGNVVARIGGRGLVVFVLLLIASGVVGVVVGPPILARLTLDPAAVASVRASAGAAATGAMAGASGGAVQGPADWFVALVPSNAFRAAVDGAMLPLIVFSMLLGLALLKIDVALRDRIVVLFRGISESMLVIVRWLLELAPVGVFALAVPLVARLGVAAIGALATYVVLVSLAAAVYIALVLYPAAAWFAGLSLRGFARAVLPAQAVAFSSRSSLAALPALIEASRDVLRLPEEISSFFIPLATVVFRSGAVLGLTIGTLFVARIYGVGISSAQLATVVMTAVATSFSIPGIPGGSIVAMVPVLSAVGLPIEGIGILLGVDTIPDMFRTTANVTGQLAAATIIGRSPSRTAEAASSTT
jgi:Na+/H+-dicarboxylate symporter